jgi:hypothetical protein
MMVRRGSLALRPGRGCTSSCTLTARCSGPGLRASSTDHVLERAIVTGATPPNMTLQLTVVLPRFARADGRS